MGWFCSVASWLAELAIGRRLRRCPHRMVQMSDGPCCAACGTFWRWEA